MTKAPYRIPLWADRMIRVVNKHANCISENKGADQLPNNRVAYRRLCFRYIDRIIPLLPLSELSSFYPLFGLYSQVCVGKPEDRFSHDAAHL